MKIIECFKSKNSCEDFGDDSMEYRRGWHKWYSSLGGECWTKPSWSFGLKFSGVMEEKFFNADDHSELQLEDVVQHVTVVTGVRGGRVGIAKLFNALDLSKPSLVRAILLIGNGASVNLAENNNTEVGLGKALRARELPNLSCLDISNNRIGDEGAKCVGRAILSGELKNLAELRIIRNDIGDDGLMALAGSFQQRQARALPNLKTLDLAENKITEVGLMSLGEALTAGKLPNLSQLDVSFNDIGDEGAKVLGLAIRSGELKHLAVLAMNSNSIADDGLMALVNSFRARLLPNLLILDLRRNRFTRVGMLALVEASSGCLNSLEVLDLRKQSDLSFKNFGRALFYSFFPSKTNALEENVAVRPQGYCTGRRAFYWVGSRAPSRVYRST